jgi:hypothetical protein
MSSKCKLICKPESTKPIRAGIVKVYINEGNITPCWNTLPDISILLRLAGWFCVLTPTGVFGAARLIQRNKLRCEWKAWEICSSIFNICLRNEKTYKSLSS